MAEDKQRYIPFLRKIFLFKGFSDEDFEAWSAAFTTRELPQGAGLYQQGGPPNEFFIVIEGKLRITHLSNRRPIYQGMLIPGDYAGEDFLLHRQHMDSIVAESEVEVLVMPVEALKKLLADYPKIQDLLMATAESRQIAREQRFDWLGLDETIYLIVRRHPFFLAVALFAPILLLIACIPVLVFGLSSLEPSSFNIAALWVGGIMAFFGLVWLGWNWLDYGNDYYIVTSQRVLWLEKVIFLYDSRQEAPLSTVNSKNITYHQVLRFFIDYGNLIVRTITGSIAMKRAYRPGLLDLFIDGLQLRARDLARLAEAEEMENVIRRRLGLPLKVRRFSQAGPVQPAQPFPQAKGLNKLFSNFLHVRYEVDGAITYRKHWFVLLQKTWLPLVFFTGVIALMVLLASNEVSRPAVIGLPIVVWGLILFGLFLWWGYHYWDWRNDIYVVTRDRILDIERKPLSREEKKSAQLENILSLEHERRGIIGLLLNFGTVKINVGTAQFDFVGVYDPATIQYEIFDRMLALRKRKEEENSTKERERIADWLLTYHTQAGTKQALEDEADEFSFE